MPAARTFRDLMVWQKAHEFVLAIYHFTEPVSGAREVRLGAPDASGRRFHPRQYCRGFGKRSQAEKSRFLNSAEGSLEECRYYLILAQDLRYGQTESLMNTLEEVSRLLNAYTRAILASGS
jgi:hypothetical protein